MSDIVTGLEEIQVALDSIADILSLTTDSHDRAKIEGIMVFCSREIARRNEELGAIISTMMKQKRAA